jgi:hypothetical protein
VSTADVAAASARDRSSATDRTRWFAETFGIVGVAGVLLLVFGLTSSQFLLSGNIRNIFVQISARPSSCWPAGSTCPSARSSCSRR